MEWPSGRRYEGNWKRGLFNGYGVLTSEKGIPKTGIWESGRCIQLIVPEMQ